MRYAGIGSRKTPTEILTLMAMIARVLCTHGWILRSGGALGADKAFYIGAANQTEIMSPWNGYNGFQGSPSKEAIELASKYHPNWQACSQGARKLHGRNSEILLGKDLNTPVEMVICWTPKGLITGGTGLALRIAQDRNIPIFNLATCDKNEPLDYAQLISLEEQQC